MTVQETRARCEHRPSSDPRASEETCVKCGVYPIPAWYLTEAYARQFYDALGLTDLADHSITRLRMGGGQYSWTAYLDRENIPEGRDEAVDWLHYLLFETLRTYRLEHTGELTAERGEEARVRFMRAAQAVVIGIREADAGAAALRD